MRRVRWLLSAPLLVALAVGGCTGARRPAGQPTPSHPAAARLAWRQVALPADPRGRPMIRAVSACDARWFVAGAILSPNGSTAPALWTSADGVSFTSMPVEPSSAYGPSHVLSSVACRGADVVAVGASSGGAHGNPRTNTWVSTDGGPLIEVPFTFELFGGPNAVGVGRLRSGGAGFLIVGGRIDARGGGGAAVWQSPDGRRPFTLIDADPELESDERGVTEADDSVVLPDGYVAVGGITPPHSHLADRDPLAWHSPDGHTWQRADFPASSGDDLLQRVIAVSGGLLAVGTDPTGFGVWSGDSSGSRWRRVSGFGGVVAGSSVPTVTDLVAAGPVAYAVVSDAADFALWHGTGSDWQRVDLPVAVSASPALTGPRVVCATAMGGALMLGVDDGTAASVWIAPVS